MEQVLKVLIADDHPLIVQGVRRALGACDDIEVVGEARSGAEVLPLVERRKPDIVLLDLHMPEMDGVECIEQIKHDWPEIKAIVLSGSDDRASIDAAVKAGANAYVIKSVSSLDVPGVLRQVAAGYSVFHSPKEELGESGSSEQVASSELTERELTILAAVAGGLTTKAISNELWVSEHTVKFHLTNIYRKLGVSNRSGAVRYAYEHRLVPVTS